MEPIWGFLVQQLIRQPCMILGGVAVKTYARTPFPRWDKQQIDRPQHVVVRKIIRMTSVPKDRFG